MSKQSPIKEQFHQANALINAQRYDEARDLLKQINHPKAQEWLTQLEDKQKQSTPIVSVSSTTIVYIVGAIVLIVGLILGVMFAPTLIESLQPNSAEQYMDDTVVSDEEILYSHLASYCYQITGYGSELCLDWADLVIAEHEASATICLEPYLDVATVTDDDYFKIGNCFIDNSVPSPY